MSPNLRRVLSVIVPVAVVVLVALATRSGDGAPASTEAGVPSISVPSLAPTTTRAGATTSPDDPGTTEATAASPGPTADDTGGEVPAFAVDMVAAADTCVTGAPDAVGLDELPEEALDTIELIDAEGPFPYDQDGSTFQNREGLLPDHERGYYREFTVETPGSDDRGARRIVTGECGEGWYTDDHYDSFALIEAP